MRVELFAIQEIDEGLMEEVNICQSDIEYLADYAELLLKFTKALGYTYVDKITFTLDNKQKVETVR